MNCGLEHMHWSLRDDRILMDASCEYCCLVKNTGNDAGQIVLAQDLEMQPRNS
jgi:hypothetical protein